MRTVLFGIAAISALAGCTAHNDREVAPGSGLRPDPGTISGEARYQDQHCGGAALTEEQYARMIHPIARTRFLVLVGDRNAAAKPAATFLTDEYGHFELERLPPGRYCVVRATRQITAEGEAKLLALPPSESKKPDQTWGSTWVDEDCLKRLPLQCDVQWEVGSPRFRATFVLPGHTCPWSRPCHHYFGPPPP